MAWLGQAMEYDADHGEANEGGGSGLSVAPEVAPYDERG